MTHSICLKEWVKMGAVLNEPDLCKGSFCHFYYVPSTENRPVRQLVSWHVTVHNGLHNV